jgi:hypothetical protein
MNPWAFGVVKARQTKPQNAAESDGEDPAHQKPRAMR